MPYYRGDYVGQGGNYYRGDPFLGSALGFIAKKVGLGKLAAKAGRWAVGRITGSGLKKAAIGTGLTLATGVAIDKATGGGITTGVTRMTTPVLEMFGGGQKKKYRRMNPLNPKALRRALRRAEGFEKFAKSTMSTLYKTSTGTTRSRKFKKQTAARS